MSPAQTWLNQSSAPSAHAADAPHVPPTAMTALAVAGVIAVGLGLWFVATPPGGGASIAADAPADGAAPLAASARPSSTANLGPRLVSGDPALCLAAASTGVGAPLIVARCDGSRTQRWLPADDGTIRLGKFCMDVAGAETADGTIVQAARCNDNRAQQFVADGGKLVSDLAGKCVDIVSSRLVHGAGIAIRPCDDIDGRSWTYAR
jgi:hypothetical protein